MGFRADPRRIDSWSDGWLGQTFEHDADHCETNEGGDSRCIALEIACKTTVTTDPGEGPLDDPAFGQDDEVTNVAALDDLDLPAAGCGDHISHSRSLIAPVGEYPRYEGKASSCCAQQSAGAVAVLNVAGKNAHAEQKAERVDEDVAFAARDFLARIVTLRIERKAPF